MIELNKIYEGDALAVLKTFPDECVNCCVTSPPYWGLRDYGTEPTIFGGDKNCQHDFYTVHKKPIGGKNHKDRPPNTGSKNTINNMDVRGKGTYSDFCSKCNAWRGQLGLEPTPELFVEHIAMIFNEVKRVLKKDGTLWLNLGDSYAGGAGRWGGNKNMSDFQTANKGSLTQIDIAKKWQHDFIKPKDLIGIPWMVAFALRAAGWYLRSDIIWHKPNPMPESVTDRPTKSHEYIFLLSKSKKYYYDADAIKTEIKDETILRLQRGVSDNHKNINGAPGQTPHTMNQPRKNIKHKNLQTKGQQAHSMHKARLYGISGTGFDGHSGHYDKNGNVIGNGSANKKSVWTVTTKPYKEAHFATFPEALIVDCIKAGCPVDGIVLDPFMGAGTTAIVARKLNRNFIGIELNKEYIKIAENRIERELGGIFDAGKE